MNSFLRDAVVTVLTSTLNELILLCHGKHLRSRTIQKNVVNNKSPELDKNRFPLETLNEIKLNTDLKKLIDTFLETLDELQSNGTIYTLLATIDQETEKNSKEEQLIQKHKSSILLLRNLKSRLTDSKTEGDAKILRASETLNNLKTEWRIINKINALEYELVKKWEYTRFTQATIVGQQDEEVLETNILELVSKTETEQRVIFDFQAYSKQQCDRYSELIEQWKKRYSEELNNLLVSISEKENKIKELSNTYEKYSEIYSKRKEFIVEYLELRAEQNRLLQMEMKRIESAVKIQAWWRGLMVRRCLGPYRKKSKKGRKAKKAK